MTLATALLSTCFLLQHFFLMQSLIPRCPASSQLFVFLIKNCIFPKKFILVPRPETPEVKMATYAASLASAHALCVPTGASRLPR